MFAAPLCFVILLSGLNSSNLFAGIEGLTIIISPQGQQVILAGDVHNTDPRTQTDRLVAAIEEQQKQDPTPFEVYIEQPAGPFLDYESNEILIALAQKLKRLNIIGVTLNNCEIRNVSILAQWFLWKENPEEEILCTFFDSGERMCAIHTASLTDLNKEFDVYHDSLLKFSKTLGTELQDCFAKELSYARSEMSDFNDQIKPFTTKTEALLDAIINVYRFDRIHPTQYKKANLEEIIRCSFSRLFDLNIMRLIITAPRHHKQLFLCGGRHMRAVREFLKEVNWRIPAHPKALQQSENPDEIDFELIQKLRAIPE